MTLPNSSPARETAPPRSSGWDGEESNRQKGSPGRQNVEPNPVPIGTEHNAAAPVPQGWTPGRGGAGGVSSRGCRSPTCGRPALPGAAGPLPALWRGLPVAYPRQRLSSPRRRLRRARERRSSADLFRERAGCQQELKLLCKEQRRRAGAGRRPRGPPPPRGCSRRRRRRRRAPSRIGGGSSRARQLTHQARAAPICPRRAALPRRSIRGRGGRSAGGGSRGVGSSGGGSSGSGGGGSGSSRTPSSAPAAPPPSLPVPGDRVAAAAVQGETGQGLAAWGSAARRPTAGGKLGRGAGWGRERLGRNSGPCSLPQVTRLSGCV